jgi:DNA end-binding protein Ku
MATKVWSGFLNFGLLSIPCVLNVAARNKRVDLNTFHVACNTAIKMPKWCPRCQVQLQPTETYRGFDAGKGKGVVPLTDEEMEAITPTTEKVMEIREVVNWKDVDPIYLAESFYCVPDPAGAKAYSLLVQTLKETGRVAVVQLTKGSREHVAILRPKGNGLALNYLWYETEIAQVAEFNDLKAVTVSAAEMKLAKQLVESLVSDFTPSQYEDSYNQRLNTLIASKLDKAVQPPTPVNVPKMAATVDISAALEASLKAPKRKPPTAVAPEQPAKGKGKKTKAA